MFFFIHITENITEIHVDPELEMLCRTNNGCDAGLNLNEVIPTRPCPTGDKEDYFIYLCEMNKFNFPICGQDLQQVTFYSHVSRLFWCRVLPVKREPSHLICGIRSDRVATELLNQLEFKPTFSTSLKKRTSRDTRASLIRLRMRTNMSILIILLVLEGLSSLLYCKSWKYIITTSKSHTFIL